MNEKVHNYLFDLISTHTNLDIFWIVKPKHSLKDFIVFNYSIDDEAYSNDKPESYVVDSSILVSMSNLKELIKTVRTIEKNTPFKRVASGQNIDTNNWEFILYGCFEMYGDDE